MATVNKAAIDSLISSILTSQVSPDSITPTTLGQLVSAIAESYYNKVDGIEVNGMTNMIAGVGNGQLLPDILSIIMSQIQGGTNAEGMIPNLFKAEKTVDQVLPGTVVANTGIVIAFEDDYTTPLFDSSNLFYRDKFVANGTMTKSFATEKICFKMSSVVASTWRVRILKNGTEIATTATFSNTAVDEYGNSMTSANGFVFPSVVIAGVALSSGDVITTEIYCVTLASSTTCTILSTNAYAKPAFSNA